jgi:uncharacterized metal-binding protein
MTLEGKKVLFYACSGGSNTGQIANDAARELNRLGKGKMGCTMGLWTNLSNVVAAAQDGVCVAIDGCDSACAMKALASQGIEPALHVLATELGIVKSGDPNQMLPEQIDKVVAAVLEHLPVIDMQVYEE